MTDPSFDEERELRSALGTLLADEPPPAWAVTDDVARGRTHLARRRARLGGGIALVAVLALVVGLVGPWRSVDRTNPLPLGSATPTPAPSGESAAVADYLASLGWPVTSTKLTMDVEDGSIVSTTYAVRSATTEGMTAQLTVRSYNTPPPAGSTTGVAGFRVGSALQRCGAACGHGEGMMLSCAVSGCADAVAYAWVERATADFAVGELLVEQRWSDGTQLEAVVSTRSCSPCAAQPSQPGFVSGVGTIPSFLSREQAGRALSLTGKPALRGAPTPVPSTTGATPTPTPSAWSPSPDPSYRNGIAFVTQSEWGRAVAGALPGTVTSVHYRGSLAIGVEQDFRMVRNGTGTKVAVWAVAYDGGTPVLEPPAAHDPCASFGPSCTVIRPWTAATSASGAASGLISVVERTGAGAGSATGYAGPYTIRTVLLQRGSTELWIDSDSRDVDPSGRFTSSSAPGLTADELVALAAGLPLPIRFSAAVDAPWVVGGTGSASASPGSG